MVVQVNSAIASSHQNPSPRVNVPRKGDELPPISDFSIDGILAAIQPDIEGTMEAIAEIMGRSRLTLANEYGSHMPPQGEIRNSLLPVEENYSNEQFAGDNIIIVPDGASLVDGSHTGSAAYGLLERLRITPQRRNDLSPTLERRSPTTPHSLLNNGARATEPTISEMFLSAGANDRPASSPGLSDDNHTFLYDDTMMLDRNFAPQLQSPDLSMQTRMQNLSLVSDLRGLATWLNRERREPVRNQENAEARLRAILERHSQNDTGPDLCE